MLALKRMTGNVTEQDRQKLTSVHLWFVDTPYVLSFVGTCMNTNQAASAQSGPHMLVNHTDAPPLHVFNTQ